MPTDAPADVTQDRGSPDYPHSSEPSPESSDTDQDPMHAGQSSPIVPEPNPEHDTSATIQVLPSTGTATPQELIILPPESNGDIPHDDIPAVNENILNVDEDIGDLVTIDSPDPINSSGHFSDILPGTHLTEGRVAVKRLRRIGTTTADAATLEKHFSNEYKRWKALRHKYILRCIGSFRRGIHLHFVSPFMANGTLFDWIKIERPGLELLRFISELSDALAYIHSEKIVHGDVKAQNILISDDLSVKLCDFGLTKIAETHTNTQLKGAGSFQWKGPELWNNESKTLKSDLYAFAMTIVQVLTGKIPFVGLNDCSLMVAVVMKKERPGKVPEVSFDGTSYAPAWKVAEKSWHHEASERISMNEAAELLRA